MARAATLEVRRDQARRRWYLTLPPRFSPTGKRRREYFRYREDADRRVEHLKKLEFRSQALVRKAGPDLIENAVTYDELFQIYGFSGLKEACEKFAAILEAERKAVAFGELLAIYERTQWEDWSKSSRTTWDWLKKHLRVLEERSINAMDSAFWTAWLRKTADKKSWSASTFNSVAKRVSSIWTYAVSQEMVGRNPLAGVTRRKIRRKEVPVLEVEQALTLMHTAWNHDREIVPYFAIAMFAGLRPDSELATLCWEDVNFEEGWIRVHFGNKTDTKRFVPIEGNLMAWLEPWKDATGRIIPTNLVKRRRYVVRGKYQSPPGSKAADWAPIADWSKRDLARHSYGSYLDGKYRDRNMVKENMGHTDFDTYEQHYRNARTPKQAEEYWTILPPGAVVEAKAAPEYLPASPEQRVA